MSEFQNLTTKNKRRFLLTPSGNILKIPNGVTKIIFDRIHLTTLLPTGTNLASLSYVFDENQDGNDFDCLLLNPAQPSVLWIRKELEVGGFKEVALKLVGYQGILFYDMEGDFDDSELE